MIIIDKQLIKDKTQLMSLISKEKEYILNNIKIQTSIKDELLNYVQKFTDYNIPLKSENSAIYYLENIKKYLDICNNNLSLLKDISNHIENNNSKFFDEKYIDTILTITDNTLKIQEFLASLSSNLKLNTYELNLKSNMQIKEIDNKYTNNINDKIKISSKNSNDEFLDNTLIISEVKGKVILPFYKSVLEKELNENSKFSNLKELIDLKYSIPLNNYKNLAFSRFKEAYKLMREKEKSSIKDAFELGMELLFNYNLHPAIITACKNINELDIYLDYLETNETSKFDLFDVLFEIPPKLVKSNK